MLINDYNIYENNKIENKEWILYSYSGLAIECESKAQKMNTCIAKKAVIYQNMPSIGSIFSYIVVFYDFSPYLCTKFY